MKRTAFAVVVLAFSAQPIVSAEADAYGCGTVYDTYEENEHGWDEWGHAKDIPQGWIADIGYANVKWAHPQVEPGMTLNHTESVRGYTWDHSLCAL